MWAVHALVVMLEWASRSTCSTARAAAASAQGCATMQAALTAPWLGVVLRSPRCSRPTTGCPAPRRRDARPVAADGRDDGRRPVGDRRPAGTVGALGRVGEPGEPRDAGGRRSRRTGARRAGARRQHRHASSRSRSKRPGATWSSATSTGAATARGSIRACARPRCGSPPQELAPNAAARRRAGWLRAPRGESQARALRTQRAAAASSAHQRRALPRAARQRAGAQLDQRAGLAAARDLSDREATQLPRAGRGAGGVSHQRRHLAARRRPAADRRRRRSACCCCSASSRVRLLDGGGVQPASTCCWRPVVVLAPAFGETRACLFRAWAARLLGAVVSKLLFAFLLGVVLAVRRSCRALRALGWWTQWLLMSAFWWAAFMRRASGARGRAGRGARASRRSARSRGSRCVAAPRAGHRARRARRTAPPRARAGAERGRRPRRARTRARIGSERSRAGDRRGASSERADEPDLPGAPSAARARAATTPSARALACAPR